MPNYSRGLFAGTLVLLMVGLDAPAGAQASAIPANLMADFTTRLQRYMDVRQDPAPAVAGADRAAPTAVVDRRGKLADQIRKKRQNAKPGDVLFPDLVTEIKAIFRNDRFTISGRQATAMGRDTDRPPDSVAVPRVNQEFPKGYGLVSPPATILVKLPELPEALEYRLVGPHLVLRDIDANLIVDVAPNVLAAR